jgi:hypothetical protein
MEPKISEYDLLTDRLVQGLSPRYGIDNLKKLGERIKETAKKKDGVAMRLAMFRLGQLYWLIARIIGEAYGNRIPDLYSTLKSFGASGKINPSEEECLELGKLYDSLEWRTEPNPDQVSPGPLLFFSQYTNPTAERDLRMQRHGGAVRVLTQEELARQRECYG